MHESMQPVVIVIGMTLLAFFTIWNFIKYFRPRAKSSGFMQGVRNTNQLRIPGFVKFLIIVGALVWGVSKLNHSSSSSTSLTDSSEPSQAMKDYVYKTHHCTWCGKEYHGNGYGHVLDVCAAGTGIIDVQCSEKCCFESWNAGRH